MMVDDGPAGAAHARDTDAHYAATGRPDQDAGHDDHARRDRLTRLLHGEGSSVLARCAISVCLMFLIIAATATGALYWRLGRGPMVLPFLSAQALETIRSKLPPGFRVDLSDVAVERRDGGLVLVMENFILRDAANEQLAAAPRVAVAVNVMGLLAGAFEPRSIIVEGASAIATIEPNGRISFTANGTAPGDAPAAPSGVSIAAMTTGLDAVLAMAGSIDAVEFRNASLTVNDQALGRDAVYEAIDLSLRRTSAAGGLALSLAAGGGSVNVTIEGRGDGARLVDMQARDIQVSKIALAFAPGAKPPDLVATVDILARARIGEAGSVDQASLDVTSGKGSWTVDDDLPPFRFDEAAIGLRWDPVAGAILVDRAMMRAGEGGAAFQGKMVPPFSSGSSDWLIDLDAPAMTIAGSGPQDAALKLDVASIRARYDPAHHRLGIDKGEFSGPSAGLALAGSVTFGGQTPGIGLGIAATRMPVTAMKRFWPFFAAAPAREWFTRNVFGGTIESATLSLAIPPDALVPVHGKIPLLPDEAVSGEMKISNASMQVADTLPPLTGGAASAMFTGHRVYVSMPQATVDVPGSGTLDLTAGTYEIADLVPTPALQHIEFLAKGPAAAVAKLMTLEPLAKAAGGSGIAPETVTGDTALKVKIDLPLAKNPRQEDIGYSVSGTIDDATIDGFEGQRVERGSLKVAIEPGVVLLTGKAVLAGLPATIDYRKADGAAPQITVGVVLDDAARKKKGIDFGDAMDGSISAEIRIEKDDGSTRYDVDVDLAAARIRDLLPGWQKPPGRPGRARFTVLPGGPGTVVRDFSLVSGPVALSGDLAFASDGKLKHGSFDMIRFAPGDEARGTLDPFGDGWKVVLKGAALDLRPVLVMLQRRGAGGKGGDVSADVQLDRAIGFGDETLTGLQLVMETKGPVIRKFVLKGEFSGGAIAGNRRDEGPSPEIFLQTPDAGSLLRFLDYYSHIQGGVLQAAFTPRLDATAGQVFLRDFQVTEEPALGQYRSTLRQSPERSAAVPLPAVDSDSAQFSKLRLTFSRTAERLDITEGVVWGPDIGANLTGSVDYASDRVNLVGTFVPAYALNNLFSRIPVIGMILGGGQNEGLFAINFKVSGPASAPTLTVNPLSAIAPGFLRKLFEFQKQ